MVRSLTTARPCFSSRPLQPRGCHVQAPSSLSRQVSVRVPAQGRADPCSQHRHLAVRHAWRHPPVAVPCYQPLRLPRRDKAGNRFVDVPPLVLPCGKCVGCRIDHSHMWQTRIVHEAKQYEENAFLTLTYSDAKMPADYGLSKRELQLFLKRLREELYPVRIRYFACGEYGSETKRPHYHVILFGFAFLEDRKAWSKSKRGHINYVSATLDRIWGLGLCTIGTFSADTATYVASYALKEGRNYSSKLDESLLRVNRETGEVRYAQREFVLMSRRPGIGAEWYAQFESDCYPSGYVIVDGHRVRVPAYYRRKFNKAAEEANPTSLVPGTFRSDQKAREFAFKHKADNTPERLAVREELARLKLPPKGEM